MKKRFRVVHLKAQNGGFYCVDNLTGSRTSLHTKDRDTADRLVFHKNEAEQTPLTNRRIGMTYLSSADPVLSSRTWKDVMADIVQDKAGPTRRRWDIAIRDSAFKLIENLVVVTTLPDQFMAVLRAGTVSTNVYLRRLQNHCLDMGWLPIPILPKKKFPKIKHRERRAITWDEHCRIINREMNPERRDFYELCWYLGGSQTDVASLHAEDIDYEGQSFSYARKKTNNFGGTKLGPKAMAVILRRPKTGPLFPYLITVPAHRILRPAGRDAICKIAAPCILRFFPCVELRRWRSRSRGAARHRIAFVPAVLTRLILDLAFSPFPPVDKPGRILLI